MYRLCIIIIFYIYIYIYKREMHGGRWGLVACARAFSNIFLFFLLCFPFLFFFFLQQNEFYSLFNIVYDPITIRTWNVGDWVTSIFLSGMCSRGCLTF